MPDGDERSALYQFKRHQHLAREGEEQQAVFFLEDGWAARYRVLSDGRRQINALFLPGEYCEPQWILSPQATYPVIALTTIRARAIPIAELDEGATASLRKPSILKALLLMINRQADWTVSLARRTASERICGLFCELLDRLRVTNRVVNNRCPMPLTQYDIADIAGLTPVHVNRVLQVLRSQGLVELDSKWLRLPDPDAVRQLSAEPPTCRSAALDITPRRNAA
jgi:CRP-like cAMP-binding protein